MAWLLSSPSQKCSCHFCVAMTSTKLTIHQQAASTTGWTRATAPITLDERLLHLARKERVKEEMLDILFAPSIIHLPLKPSHCATMKKQVKRKFLVVANCSCSPPLLFLPHTLVCHLHPIGSHCPTQKLSSATSSICDPSAILTYFPGKDVFVSVVSTLQNTPCHPQLPQF
jgi:hypothetical protein